MTLLSRFLTLALLFATTSAHAQTIPPWWYDVNPPAWGTNVGTNYDGQRTTLGDYPPTSQFANGTANVPEALVGAVSVPSGSSVTQVNGVSGYALTASSAVPAVGVYAAGLIANGAPTGEAEGFNANVSNCGQPQCVSGSGQAFGIIIGAEADINSMSGGAHQAPGGTVFGFLANGASDVQPLGDASAFEVWGLGSVSNPPVPWRNGFHTIDGSAGIGLQLGSQHANRTSDYSQAILLHSKSASGGDLIGQIQTTPYGEVSVTPQSGQFVVNGWGLRVTSAYAPASSSSPCQVGQIQWDGGEIYVCIAAGHWREAHLVDF